MQTMIIDNTKQIKVFVSKKDSPRKNQVRIEYIIVDTEKPMILDAQ